MPETEDPSPPRKRVTFVQFLLFRFVFFLFLSIAVCLGLAAFDLEFLLGWSSWLAILFAVVVFVDIALARRRYR